MEPAALVQQAARHRQGRHLPGHRPARGQENLRPACRPELSPSRGSTISRPKSNREGGAKPPGSAERRRRLADGPGQHESGTGSHGRPGNRRSGEGPTLPWNLLTEAILPPSAVLGVGLEGRKVDAHSRRSDAIGTSGGRWRWRARSR